MEDGTTRSYLVNMATTGGSANGDMAQPCGFEGDFPESLISVLGDEADSAGFVDSTNFVASADFEDSEDFVASAVFEDSADFAASADSGDSGDSAASAGAFSPYDSEIEEEKEEKPLPPESERLSKLSPKDRRWDEFKNTADIVEDEMNRREEYKKRASRMSSCARNLVFGVGKEGYHLLRAQYCHVRGCPVCAWRRSLLWLFRMSFVWPELVKSNPGTRFAMLTLTVPNCETDSLRSTLQGMTRSWHAFIKRSRFTNAVIGWLRNTEVTRSENGMSHPHYHVLLAFHKDYFDKSAGLYIEQKDWAKMWTEVCKGKVEYRVDIRMLRPSSKDPVDTETGIRIPKKAILEVTKYSTKIVAIKKDVEWFLNTLDQCRGLRFVAAGGILKDILKMLRNKPSDEELVSLGLSSEDSISEEHWFKFYSGKNRGYDGAYYRDRIINVGA